MEKSYRPHNPGHDYYAAGAYHITLVVTERQRLLSTLGTDAVNPSVALTPVGQIVWEEWEKTVAIQAKRGRKIRIHAQVCMPDHWHGVIEVLEPMDKSLGFIIMSFKSACTARWRREITGYADTPSFAYQLQHMSREKRNAFNATRPLIERPLFDDDYDDTICINEEHLARMIHYVEDNPRRAIIMKLFPQFMQRCMHVVIDGVDYAAFGNLFLLRWARKVQVFCHRKARYGQLTAEERQQYGYTYEATSELETRVPYTDTQTCKDERDAWVSQVLQGATVMVTPGISKGEQAMKNLCLSQGYPLIHLQKEPIGRLWKPEQSRFDACTNGTLLILAPWSMDDMGDVNGVPVDSNYSRFHNLNKLAEQICAFDGTAMVVR